MSKEFAFRLDPKSWDMGFQDGLAETDDHRHEAADGFAYGSGWIEGDAARRGEVR